MDASPWWVCLLKAQSPCCILPVCKDLRRFSSRQHTELPVDYRDNVAAVFHTIHKWSYVQENSVSQPFTHVNGWMGSFYCSNAAIEGTVQQMAVMQHLRTPNRHQICRLNGFRNLSCLKKKRKKNLFGNPWSCIDEISLWKISQRCACRLWVLKRIFADVGSGECGFSLIRPALTVTCLPALFTVSR